MTLITKKEMETVGARLVGPIAEGETPEQAVARMARTFGSSAVTKYAFVMHKKPMKGGPERQQFPVIVGSVWAV